MPEDTITCNKLHQLLEVQAEEAFLAFLDAQLPAIRKLRDSFRRLQVSKLLSTDSERPLPGPLRSRPAPQQTLAKAVQPSRLAALRKSSQLVTPKSATSRPGLVPLLRLDWPKRCVAPGEQPPASDGARFERRRLSDRSSSKVSSFCSHLKQKPEAVAPGAKPEAMQLGSFVASAGLLSLRAPNRRLAELRGAKLPAKSPKKFPGSPLAVPKPTRVSSRAALHSSKLLLDRQPPGRAWKQDRLFGKLDCEIKEEAELSDARGAQQQQASESDSRSC